MSSTTEIRKQTTTEEVTEDPIETTTTIETIKTEDKPKEREVKEKTTTTVETETD